MQDYYESWKFKHPGPKDFLSFFNKHLDEDINWFFENMIDSTTYIDYKISKKMENIFLRTLDHSMLWLRLHIMMATIRK